MIREILEVVRSLSLAYQEVIPHVCFPSILMAFALSDMSLGFTEQASFVLFQTLLVSSLP